MNSFVLNETDKDSYELRIKMTPTQETSEELAAIAKNNKLSLKEETGEVIFYTPK